MKKIAIILTLLMCASGANAMNYINVNDWIHYLDKGKLFVAKAQASSQDIAADVICNMNCTLTPGKKGDHVDFRISYYKNGKIVYLNKEMALGQPRVFSDLFSAKQDNNAEFRLVVDDCIGSTYQPSVECKSTCRVKTPSIPLIIPPKGK